MNLVRIINDLESITAPIWKILSIGLLVVKVEIIMFLSTQASLDGTVFSVDNPQKGAVQNY